MNEKEAITLKQMNPTHIEQVIEWHNKGPIIELLSMKIVDLGIGTSFIETVIENKHMNPFGIMHGGVYATLLDTAAYWSAYCEMDEDVGYTTSAIKIDYLGMLKAGKISVEGRSIKVGKSIALAEATAKDPDGKILAHATSNLLVLGSRQSINQAIKAMGGSALPPKFINE